MSENLENTKKQVPSLSEIQAQLKGKKAEVLTPENKGELKNTLIYSLIALLAVIYLYNNPFNFTSFLGIIKFIQLILIAGIIFAFYKVYSFMQIFKGQTHKIEHIYESKIKK
jgi:hypothetical protein